MVDSFVESRDRKIRHLRKQERPKEFIITPNKRIHGNCQQLVRETML